MHACPLQIPIRVDFVSKQDEKELFFQQLEEEMNVRHFQPQS